MHHDAPFCCYRPMLLAGATSSECDGEGGTRTRIESTLWRCRRCGAELAVPERWRRLSMNGKARAKA